MRLASLLQFLLLLFGMIGGVMAQDHRDQPVTGAARTSRLAPARVLLEVHGTEDRNNPWRQPIVDLPDTDTLYVSFRLQYSADSLDTPADDEGEFFVVWLDEIEGNDVSTHNPNVPNIGVHVSGDRNAFMVRFASGREQFADPPLEGDRWYRLVGRLWKSKPGPDGEFDRWDLWVDPVDDENNRPHASVNSERGPARIAWMGLATGRKTEPTDRILVADLGLHTTWESALGLPPASEPALAAESTSLVRTVDFDTQVFPLLAERCWTCHGGEDPESGIRLDQWEELLNHVSPGEAAGSPLVSRIESDDPAERMPPPEEAEALGPAEIALLRTWIDEGVSWNEELAPTESPSSDHWSLQPLQRPDIPVVARREWVRTPVDAFVARQHEALGLAPANPADPATLRRRLSLDLTGLPPPMSREVVNEEELVEQLLASLPYGERWGRHWLDVARWAESNGHQHNRFRPHAWRYRDYVVRAFAEDLPFDEFMRQQVAGDLLGTDEGLVATGFLAAARYSGNELDKRLQRNDILVDVANTTARAFLGLTLDCAQCHSHKFDPISLRDYYRFQAFFAQGQPENVLLGVPGESDLDAIEARWEIFDRAHGRIVEGRRRRGHPDPILVTPSSVIGGLSEDEGRRFRSFESAIEALPQTWAWYAPVESGRLAALHSMRWPLPRLTATTELPPSYILIRGQPEQSGPEVSAGWPAVFGPMPSDSAAPRLALADWLASPANPLTARVWANRVWQWHFGRGLVETSDDFGSQGTPPTHPELLDWLACELIDSGWSTRHLHRLILHSSTYRQSTAFSAAHHDCDPENRYLWRWHPRRLEAEAIRDSVLVVSGMLDPQVGGPSASNDTSRRRSIYLRQMRDNLPDVQTIFDAPDTFVSCARRRVSTVPQQPLFLLHHEFMRNSSRAFAARVRSMSSTADGQIADAIELSLGREADAAEIERGRRFLETSSLENFCHVLLNLNEFLYIP